MSYLSFGAFSIIGKLDDRQLRLLGWRLVKYGSDHNIYLIIGCNITQKDVLEMIKRTIGDQPKSALAFLATASPLEDTSDGLISPYALVTSGSGADMKAIEQSLQRLQTTFQAALGEDTIQEVVFCITEGFDTNFRTVFTTVSDFKFIASRILVDNKSWWPSVKFIVRRDAVT